MQTNAKAVAAAPRVIPYRLWVVKRMCPDSMDWVAPQTNLSPIMGTSPFVALPGRRNLPGADEIGRALSLVLRFTLRPVQCHSSNCHKAQLTGLVGLFRASPGPGLQAVSEACLFLPLSPARSGPPCPAPAVENLLRIRRDLRPE